MEKKSNIYKALETSDRENVVRKSKRQKKGSRNENPGQLTPYDSNAKKRTTKRNLTLG